MALNDKLNKIISGKAVRLTGLNVGEKGFITANLGRQVLYVAPDLFAAENLKEQIIALGKRAEILPEKLSLIFGIDDSVSPLYQQYFGVINKLVNNEIDILIVLPAVLMQKLPGREFFSGHRLKIELNKEYDLQNIAAKLTQMGYKKQELVTEAGDFAVRGDILDIFIDVQPVRCSFLGDCTESINYFDIAGTMGGALNCVAVPAKKMLVTTADERAALKDKINKLLSQSELKGEKLLRLADLCLTQINALENNLSRVSAPFFLPFLSYFNSGIFNFLSRDAVIIFDEPSLITGLLNKEYAEFEKSFEGLLNSGEVLSAHKNFYINKKEVFKDINKFILCETGKLSVPNTIFEVEEVISFNSLPANKYTSDFSLLKNDLNLFVKAGKSVFLSCGQAITLNKMEGLLKSFDIEFFVSPTPYPLPLGGGECAGAVPPAPLFVVANPGLEADEKSTSAEKHPATCGGTQRREKYAEQVAKIGVGLATNGAGAVALSVYNIPFSVNLFDDGLIIIGSNDLNETPIVTAAPKKAKSVYEPKVGDYVVHIVHGIGKCIGIKKLLLSTSYKDYFIIEYLGGDILYLPTEHADNITAYLGDANPKCNKIGGADFYKVKKRVKESTREMAVDLLKIYSAREHSKGFKYSKDSYLQTEFEKAFEYSYTEDQITAIADIKKDMETGLIMDRLICGDVGYGKTEVALAAAFKAIQDGKQAALICPTTILSEQHYNTCLARFRPFMVNTGLLNRFKSNAKAVLSDLAEGKINFMIGTHRLLSADVKFKDLGLLILDEEQRFGVEHKEKLKNFKNNVDVLTLSATPIPRTLYMALTGIRDISYLNTPPKDRLPVSTHVVDFSDGLLIDACKKEIERDGQVLIVYNRVESIFAFYQKVKNLLPEARIGVIHGQMQTKDIEQGIYKLFSREIQILITTVLIENGIDLPYANTLVVVDADKLGLAQLYQLRGRIGRSSRQGYAYFTFNKNKVLTEEAYKRLNALVEFSGMGNGFKIALRDLEIRGAGEILGSRQSGHIERVGYDLYIKLLNESIKELKGESVKQVREVKIDVALNAYIPPEYITGEENRISAYTKISKAASLTDAETLIKEFNNLYGRVPGEVDELIKVALIKNLSENLGIKSVAINQSGARLVFYKELNDDLNISKLIARLMKPSKDFVFIAGSEPKILINFEKSVQNTQDRVTDLLIKLQDINDE